MDGRNAQPMESTGQIQQSLNQQNQAGHRENQPQTSAQGQVAVAAEGNELKLDNKIAVSADFLNHKRNGDTQHTEYRNVSASGHIEHVGQGNNTCCCIM